MQAEIPLRPLYCLGKPRFERFFELKVAGLAARSGAGNVVNSSIVQWFAPDRLAWVVEVRFHSEAWTGRDA